MRTLELEEGNLRKLAEKVKAICRVIFQFNIRFQGLLKKIANFNKTLDSIVQSTSNNSRKYRKTYVDVNEVALLKFEMRLQLNPHDVLMLWSSVLTQGERAKEYVQNVIANDLLRLHAVPSMFRP